MSEHALDERAPGVVVTHRARSRWVPRAGGWSGKPGTTAWSTLS